MTQLHNEWGEGNNEKNQADFFKLQHVVDKLVSVFTLYISPFLSWHLFQQNFNYSTFCLL